MYTLGERLIHARNSKNFSQQSLADAIDVSRGVIFNIEKDRSQSKDIVINAICKVLDINKEWLINGDGKMENTTSTSKSAKILAELLNIAKDFSEAELLYMLDLMPDIAEIASTTELSDAAVRAILTKKTKRVAMDLANNISQGRDVENEILFTSAEERHIKKYRALGRHGKKTVNAILNLEYERMRVDTAMRDERQQDEPEVREMKVYWESSAAGLGNYLSDCDSNYDMVTFLTEEVPSDADFGIRISGDSMEPTIYDGAIAWVEATPEICSGEVGIFVLNGESYCKELMITSHKTTGKVVSLISHNEKYRPISFREGDDLKTVGRVLSTS